jgi:hypothetical protein
MKHRISRASGLSIAMGSSLGLWMSFASAQDAAPVPQVAKATPPPYSLPFQLRPVAAGNVVRSDTAVAFFKDPATEEAGSTVVTTLLASYKVTDEIAPLVRVGLVSNSPPSVDPATPASDSSTGFLNPVVGATYALKLGPALRLAPFLGVALPLGSGGGNSPEPAAVAARTVGVWARSAMDNAMFAVNDLVIFPGVGLAYLKDGFTAQGEVTVLQLMRVRGEDAQTDAARTNLTAGVHFGYFVLPALSLGLEVRHQRWLSTPDAVAANDALRATSTAALGPRFHVKLGESGWVRPGIAVVLPLDDVMEPRDYRIVQVDVPVAF